MPGKEDIFLLTSSPTLFLPRSVDKRSCLISQIRRAPLWGFTHVARSTSQITHQSQKLNFISQSRQWEWVKSCGCLSNSYAPLRMTYSNQTVSLFLSTRLFCKCDQQAECEPGEAGGCHKRDSCNQPPHLGVLADFPAVFFNMHQRYLSLKKSW